MPAAVEVHRPVNRDLGASSADPAAEPRDRLEFDWLGLSVEVLSDAPGSLASLARTWGGASPAGRGTPLRYLVLVRKTPSPTLVGPTRSWVLDRRDPLWHAHQLVIKDLLGRLGRVFVFHAASLAMDGRGVVISGPASFGKTTLAVRLVERGFTFFSDDVTVVDRKSARIVPFRRALNLRVGTRRMLEPASLRDLSRAKRGEVGGEWSVDPLAWLGPPPEPCPVSAVFLLRSRTASARLRRFRSLEIRFVDGMRPPIEGLRALRGVSDARKLPEANDIASLDVEDPRALERWLEENASLILSVRKVPEGPPDFEARPRLAPIGTFQAAIELGQEMLNRHEGSAIAREFGGREPLIAAEIAGLLEDSRCYALWTGRLDETLRLVEDAVAGRSA